jgi:phage terminase small subunit
VKPNFRSLLKLLEGNPGKRPIPKTEPIVTGTPAKPKYLKGRSAELWDEVLESAVWLTKVDTYKLANWCQMEADRERNGGKWSEARRREWRSAGSEMLLDPIARARLGIKQDGATQKDPAEEFFASLVTTR